MAEDKGADESSETESELPGGLAAAGSRTVFLSYASADAVVANQVCQALEAQGVPCWMAPRDVKPGWVYADAIVRAINDAKALVVVLSASSIGSSHVGREIERAAAKRKPIIPFRTDSAALNPELEYFLSNSQWIEADKLGMPAALAKLKEAVGRGSATSSQPVTVGNPGGGSKSRIAIAAAAAVAIGAGVALGLHFWKSNVGVQTPVATAVTDKSIAVLPFSDRSEKKDQEYFADGMAEEMVDVLAKIPQLKVIGRISSFYFKGQAEDLPAIGERLGAGYILRGSVRRGGPRIRVTAQLFEARSGAQIWAESYDRELDDVLVLQGQIAKNIARALQLAIVMDDAQELRRLKSPEAYALYLRGRSAYDRGEAAGLREAQTDFEQVLALEPRFPRAAEALALTHLALIGDYVVRSQIGWQHAVDAANLALQLDPKSALAHAIIGLKRAMYDYDWTGAQEELERALAAKSRDPVVLYNCSWLAFDIGRVDDAMHLEGAALSLDPLNPDSLQNGAIIHYLLGNFDLAEKGFRKSLEVSPTFGGNHKYLGQILLLQGRAREALKEMEAEASSNRDIGLALAYHALGQKVESEAALDREKNNRSELSEVSIATVYAYRGEIDQAFNWLDKAVAARDGALGHKLEHEPLLAPLRSDPRYKALLKKMNRAE